MLVLTLGKLEAEESYWGWKDGDDHNERIVKPQMIIGQIWQQGLNPSQGI
jgi:hypothetical protein